jgi:hypothetical protein
MKLTIGTQKVALPVDSSISIEKSSPFLDENSSSFSYPFPVPTQPNQRILGWPGKLERAGDLPDTSFVLEESGLQILRGDIEYDTITAEEIGVILKSGKTLFSSKVDGKYLSDIDYGRESWLNNDYDSIEVREKITAWDTANTTDNGKYVAAPALINPFREDVLMYVNKINKTTGNLVYDPQHLIQQQLFMLQFRAYFILEKIFESAGYTILLNDLKTGIFKDLIVFSNVINLPFTFTSSDGLTNYLNYSTLMPKITVTEFMESIASLVCLTYDIDEKLKTVRILYTKNVFAAGNTDKMKLEELSGWAHSEKKPSGGVTLAYQSQDDDKDTFSDFPSNVETITEMTLPTPTTDGEIVRVQYSDYYYVTEIIDSVYSWRWIGRLRDYKVGNGSEKIEFKVKVPSAITNADGYVYPKLEITPIAEGNNHGGVQRISFEPISELIVSLYHGRKQLLSAWIPYSSGDHWGINGGWIKEASVWLTPEFLYANVYSDLTNWKAYRCRQFTKYLKLSLAQLLQLQWRTRYVINGVEIILSKINFEIPHKGTVKIEGFTA